ncbi:YczE/YyaS/YitT family protein [Sporosarcina sp. CAU 1771]
MWRWIFFFVGIMILSLGVSMTIKGQRLGIAPWDVLHVGLYKNFGLTIGTWGIITGFVIILITAAALKQFPKLGTWVNMVMIGLFIDLFNWLLPEFTTLAGQIIIFTLGVLVVGIGCGVYVSASVGAGPRDSLMLLLVDKMGFSLKKARTIMEVVVAILGWMLGGPVGIGTVLVAIFTGQIIQFALAKSRKLLLRIIGDVDQELLFKMNLIQ